MSERIEQIRFGGSGGDSLSGRLDLPRAEPVAYALFAHCFTCSKEIPAATRITRGLVDRGIGVLRFDFTGLGGSEGDFANTNFSSNVEDIVRAADVLRQRGAAPKILVGHSLGGTAVLAAAAQVPEAVAVVTIGALFDPAHLAGLFADAASELGRAEEVSVEIGGRRFPIRRQLLEDANEQNLTDAIRSATPGASRLSRSVRRGRSHRQRPAHLRRRQAPEELRVARRRRSPPHRGTDAAYVAQTSSPHGSADTSTRRPHPSLRSVERGRWWFGTRRAAGWRRRSKPEGTRSSPTSRQGWVTTSGPRPTTFCSRRSARARQ